LAGYYLIAAGAVAGVVVLRRRGVPSFPLVAGVINVAVTVVLFYGSTRFRAPAEPSLVILAAVAADALVSRLRSGSVDPVDSEPSPAPPSGTAPTPEPTTADP
jgi:hypothetical protein